MYANNKDADQPAHPHSLISAFVVRCLDSMISELVKPKISRLYLVSATEQAGLSYLVGNPEDRFSGDEAQLFLCNRESMIFFPGF